MACIFRYPPRKHSLISSVVSRCKPTLFLVIFSYCLLSATVVVAELADSRSIITSNQPSSMDYDPHYLAQRSRSNDGPLLYPPGEEGDDYEEDWTHNRLTELSQQIRNLENEIAALRGMIEEQSAAVQRLTQDQSKRYLELDARIVKLSKVQPTSVANKMPAKAASQEQADYQSTITLMRQRRYEEAIKSLQGFLTNYPDGQFTGAALWLMGEIYSVLPEPQIEKSRQAYVRLLDRFPKHKRTPTVLYKLGLIYDQLGQKEKSKEFLMRVIKEYPGSSAAQLANNYRR